MFKTAMQRRKKGKDIVGSKYLRNEKGTLKVKKGLVMERWRSYFSSLLNKTNRYQLQEEDKVEGSIWGVTEQMVK